MNRISPLAFFATCVAVDFVLGRIKWHSLIGGLGAILGGLPLTAVLFLILGCSAVVLMIRY